MIPVVADWETYWAKGYSLSEKAWTTEKYIRDEQFLAHGCGFSLEGKDPFWLEGAQLERFIRALPWHKIALIGHNLQFDGSIFSWRYGVTPALYIDTIGMSRALVGQHSAKHSLDAISQLLLGTGKLEGLYETRGLRILPPHIKYRLVEYCKRDVMLTWRLFKLFAPHFPREEYYVMDWMLRQFTQPQLYLDDELLVQHLANVKQQKRDILAATYCELTETFVEHLNDTHIAALRKLLGSAPKYAKVLQSLGVTPPTKINDKGKVTFAFAKTDEAHKALLEHDDLRVQAVVGARLDTKSTLEETRTARYLDAAPRGAWPVGYNYSGAQNTHRMSGNQGGGGNPMNLPRGGTLRKAIICDDKYVQLVLDQKQIECRLALWYGSLSSKAIGEELKSLELMRTGGDLYSHFAGMMFGRVINKNDDPNERQIGKSATLGLGFGMGPARFLDYCKANGSVIDETMAEAAVALYRNTYKGVRAMWQTWEAAFLAAHGKKKTRGGYGTVMDGYEPEFWDIGPVEICKDPIFGSISARLQNSGLLLKYPDLQWDADGECTYKDGNGRAKMFGGKWMENIVQHSARMILLPQAVKINKRYPVVMSTYDEVVCLVRNDKLAIEEAISYTTELMRTPDERFPGLPLDVDYGYHQRYGEAKT